MASCTDLTLGHWMKPRRHERPTPGYLTGLKDSDAGPNQRGGLASIGYKENESDGVMFHEKAAQQPGLLGRCWA